MCLNVGKNNSFIAKRDIIVYKELEKTFDGKYITPYQNFPVELNKMLIPKGVATEKPNGFKYCIREGAIHANTISTGEEFKAIIKKGTKFWIQDNLEEVAAEKLYITDELGGYREETDFSDYTIEEGVDVYLKDGRRCKLTDSFNVEDVLGIYGYDDQVISLNHTILRFSKYWSLPGNPNTLSTLHDAEKDLDGYANTNQLKSLNIESEMLNYCEKLGKDWYVPAYGQIKKVVENLLRINFTLQYLGEMTYLSYWFWSSTLRSRYKAYGCYGNGSDFIQNDDLNSNSIEDYGCILPFLNTNL